MVTLVSYTSILKMPDPKVSIVIPAFNEEAYLGATLSSLKKSEQETKIDYEVIVVDNNSTDKTSTIAKSFSNCMNLRIIKETIQGRGAARARGFKEAKGDIILSADADTIFHKNWIEELTNGFKDNIVAVTTSCRIEDASPQTNSMFNFLQPNFMKGYRLIFGHYWLSGFSFGILKSVYKKSGGFDTHIQGQEDIDLGFRVAKLGKIKFINHPVIFSGRRFKDGLIKGLWDYVRTFIEVFIFGKKDTILQNLR